MGKARVVRRSVVGLAGLAALAWAAPTLPQGSPQIVTLRHFGSPAHTRIVVELSAMVKPEIHRLPTRREAPPQRLYVDLPGTGIGTRIGKPAVLGVGPVSSIRVGKRDLETARVVITLRVVEAYELSVLQGPPRVVVDIHAPRGERSEATHGQSPKSVDDVPPGQGRVVRRPSTAGPERRKGEEPRRNQNPVGPSRPTRRSRAVPLRIVVDPGHGGRDPGARGIDGLEEKTVVLAIARRLRPLLERELGATVIFTRDRDVYVPLDARTARANAERADIFLSIHTNASTHRGLAGVETYYLRNTNDRATIRLAAMENGLTLIEEGRRIDAGLSYILSDLVQQGKLGDSIDLSRSVQQGLMTRLAREHRGVADLGVKQGPFYVLVGAYMPCALVEVAFLTNPIEGKRLASGSYRDAIAEGLLEGVRRYAAGLRREHTL